VSKVGRTAPAWASTALAWWVAPLAARAHDAHPLAARALVRSWTVNPWLIALVTLASALYLWGQRARRQRRRPGASLRSLESTAFFLSMVTLVLALLSPLDTLSDLTFSAHMTQHELLMLLAAPLLVLARPLPTYLLALPSGVRSRLAESLKHPLALRLFRWATAPMVALLLHGIIRWVWHAPLLFQAALANEWVHGLQHATFFLSALLFWWGILQGRYGRAGYGVAALFVLLTAMHTGALGALLSLSEQPWYPLYAPRLREVGLDPLSDQQLAGLIMWVGAFMWLLLLTLGLLLAWLGEARRRAARGSVAHLARRQEAS
jgi:putative membrane protein